MMIKKINIIKYGKKFLKLLINGNGELNLHEKTVLSIGYAYRRNN